MSSVSNILLEKEILLESGTNELEILVFAVEDFVFGINVAKVREVLPFQEITGLPQSHPSVKGVFKLRDQVVPCVSLRNYLNVSQEDLAEGQVILTDFNKMQIAFTVDQVERIHRISWEKIMGVPQVLSSTNTPVTAVASINNQMVSMLDFELIAAKVMDEDSAVHQYQSKMDIQRDQFQVLIADDSPSVRSKIVSILTQNGYSNLQVFENGQDCWNWIENRWKETEQVEQVAHLIISDVEMPRMDGFHLTHQVKQHPQLKQIPVCLYSSIVSPDNQKKGHAVGADAQLTKPEIDKTVEMADTLISDTWLSSTNKTVQKKASTTELPKPEPKQDVQTNSTDEQQSDTNLTVTYKYEMRDRVFSLQQILQELQATESLANYNFHALLRILHNIKSASQVVPINEAVQLTHMMEEQAQTAASQAKEIFLEKLQSYIAWLIELAEEEDEQALAKTNQLELILAC